GLLSRKKFPVTSMVTHVYDKDSKGTVFSRDCMEFAVTLPTGEELLVLVNHFKSKGYGSAATSNAKRKRQAARVRRIYEERRAERWLLVDVAGDFKDTPGSDPLAPLLAQGSKLVDSMSHPLYGGDGRDGTYGNGM